MIDTNDRGTAGRLELNGGTDYLEYRYGSGGTVEILDIAVMSERRTGNGRRLIERLMASLPQGTLVWAITRASNIIAQHFYEGMKFRVVGVLRSFYQADPFVKDDVDAIMYGRTVGSVS